MPVGTLDGPVDTLVHPFLSVSVAAAAADDVGCFHCLFAAPCIPL